MNTVQRVRELVRSICARLADALEGECTCTDDEVTCWRHYTGR